MYKSVYGGAIFTSWFSLIMEIPKERNMERSRDVGGAGRCLKQPSKRSYGTKRNDLLVNQSEIDGASPKKELLSQSQKKEDIKCGGCSLLNVTF